MADDGPDIDPELLPHLFDRFVRAKDAPHEGGGNGLGLAIVDSIVKAHNGSVAAESAGGPNDFPGAPAAGQVARITARVSKSQSPNQAHVEID